MFANWLAKLRKSPEEVKLAVMGIIWVVGFAVTIIVALGVVALSGDPVVAAASKPSVADISQRLEIICPGPKTIEQNRKCAQEATETLTEERLRRAEVRALRLEMFTGLINILMTVLSAMLTLIGLVLLARTLTETRVAAGAARDAAKAAADANRGFELSAERQLRAYVHVTSATIEEFRPNGTPRIHIKYKNVGQTPAYDVSTVIELVISAPNQERSSALVSTDPAIVLGPDIESRLVETARARLGAEVYHSILTDAQWLYAYGVVRYRDAFGSQRETRFAYRYSGSSGDKGPMALSRGNAAT